MMLNLIYPQSISRSKICLLCRDRLDVTDLDVVYGRDNVFVILNQESLDLMDRIVSYGKEGD